MKKVINILLLCLLMQPVAAEIVVITHKESPIEKITKKDLIDIYFGRTSKIADTKNVLPLDYQQSPIIKIDFYKKLVDKNLSIVNAYWARLKFTGRATPPAQLPTPQDILMYTDTYSNAIGYVDSNDLTKNVKVIYRFE